MKTNEILAAALIAAIGGGTYVGVKLYKQIRDLTKKLDASMSEINEMTDIEVKETIIDAVVERKVSEEVAHAVKKSAAVAVADIEDDIHDQIEAEVEKEYDDIKESVQTEIKNQISDININKLKNEVVKQAKEAAAKKFENDLDEVLEKYNNNLEKLTSIYGSIAQKMNPKQTFEF